MAWNILIVDDSSLTRKRIRRIIEMAGLDVNQFLDAENGAQALKVLQHSSIDLVLSDLNMPEMSGAEMVHRMKSTQATKSIPVVVVSAESKTARIKELLDEGVKDYLHKPFTPEEFKDVMENLWSTTVTQKTHLLTQALMQALEKMAFITVIPVDEDMLIPQKTVLAKIRFTGAKEGKIQILAGLDFCKVLAENIAAIDEADNQNALDAIKELTNVTCGLFLPMVVSSTADVFDITVPEAEYCDNSSQWDEFTAQKNSSILNIEGHAVAAKLIVDNKVIIAETN